jgi:DHA2 family multidrug resistance protein
VATRQFSACFLVMLATGAILLSTTQYLPQLVQAEYGYTATWAGLALSPGGLVLVFMMPMAGLLAGKVQPRILIAIGATICAVAMFDMTRITGEVDFGFFVFSRMLLSVGLPFVFIPILTASFDGIPHSRTDMASALINMARNTGGSIGISLANNVLAHREQFHQGRLVELVNTSTVQFQAALKQATDYFMAHGSSLALAQQ